MSEKAASALGESRNFVVNYIKGLKERTMMRKHVMTYGLDWVIYQLALAKGWTPQRLPFVRSTEAANHKTEAEYGIDLSFLRDEGRELVIFALKDEPLKNRTWSSERTKDDLEKAMYPDLSSSEYKDVIRVFVILGYNKDDDYTGVGLFDRFVSNQPPTISDGRALIFERWNLTTISDEVHANLLSPDLLPEGVSELLRYTTAHFKQCQVGSDSWTRTMLPNWNNLISQVFESKEKDDRKIIILSVATIILGKARGDAKGSDVGYIELVERLMLRIWTYANEPEHSSIRKLASRAWVELYLLELERFYQKYGSLLKQTHAISMASTANGIDALNAGYNAYWHFARIGLFTFAIESVPDDSEGVQDYLSKKYSEFADIVETMIYNEPGALRPLIDADQAQVFLIWRLLVKSDRIQPLHDFLDMLIDRLFVRRINKVGLPFLDGHNSYKAVAEATATKQMHDVCVSSSFFCLSLMEYCLPLGASGEKLIEKIYRYLVLSIDPTGDSYADTKPLDLVCWAPKEGWEQSVCAGKQTNSVGIGLGALHSSDDDICGTSLISNLRKYKDQYLEQYPLPETMEVPTGVMILACIMNKHALPPYLWRGYVYDQKL